MSMIRAIGLGLVLVSIVSCATSGPCGFVWGAPSVLTMPTFTVQAEVSHDVRTLDVAVTNTGSAALQLVLQDWSVSLPSGTTEPLATGTTAPADVPSGVLPSITLPAGAAHRMKLFPRTHHHFNVGADSFYALDPLVPVTKDHTGAVMPDCARLTQSAELKLSVVVVGADGVRSVETLAVPIRVTRG